MSWVFLPKPSPMLMKFTSRLSRSSLTGPLILRLVPSVLRLARPRPNSFAAQNHHVHRGAFPKSRSSSPGWQVCTRRLAKNALGATMRASARSRPIVAKAASISPIVEAPTDAPPSPNPEEMAQTTVGPKRRTWARRFCCQAQQLFWIGKFVVFGRGGLVWRRAAGNNEGILSPARSEHSLGGFPLVMTV